MSTIATTRPSTNNAIGREPRVQLLPPSVRERERARGAMRLGVLIVILGIVAAGALGALGFLRQASTVAALEAANARTSELFAERAQYSEATQVATTIDQVLQTQKSMTSYEIDLAELIAALQVRLGPGMTIASLTIEVQAPWGVPLAGEDVLAPPRIANIDLAVTSSTIPEGTAFRDALVTLPGFSSAVLRDTAVGTDGVVTTHIRLALATDAVSGRFFEKAEDAEDADDAANADDEAVVDDENTVDDESTTDDQNEEG